MFIRLLVSLALVISSCSPAHAQGPFSRLSSSNVEVCSMMGLLYFYAAKGRDMGMQADQTMFKLLDSGNNFPLTAIVEAVQLVYSLQDTLPEKFLKVQTARCNAIPRK